VIKVQRLSAVDYIKKASSRGEVVSLDYLSIFRSELKIKLLLSLLNGEKKIADLRTDVETRDTTIFHILEEFGDLKLTTKSQGVYKLTSLGIIEAKITREFLSLTDVIEKFGDFWYGHDITEITTRHLLNIGALKEATLIHAKDEELGLVHKKFMEHVSTSKTIKGISPIFHSDFVSLFEQLLDKGCTIELVVDKKVLEKIMGIVDFKLARKYLSAGSLKIYLRNNLRIALALTEKSFSLGLYTLSGTYDDNMDLVSESAQAIEWGEHLFEDIVIDSKRIEF
jgi:predicted transcriptional regulator